MEDLRHSTERSLGDANQEIASLINRLTDMNAKYADTAEQLTSKVDSLEAMHGQARKREQLISSLQEDLQHKGKEQLFLNQWQIPLTFLANSKSPIASFLLLSLLHWSIRCKQNMWHSAEVWLLNCLIIRHFLSTLGLAWWAHCPAEQLLNCISSAAATVNKPTPAKSNSCYVPALQAKAYFEHEQTVRRKVPNKKRKMQARERDAELTQVRQSKVHNHVFMTAEIASVECMADSRRSEGQKPVADGTISSMLYIITITRFSVQCIAFIGLR